jgi:lipopolysaccharide/colanic/teichoic acid biosynthesis glycosyltransferase
MLGSFAAMTEAATNPPDIAVRRGAWPAVKRAMDVVIATLALLFLSPLLALIALAVRIDSRGPVVFRQARLGRALEEFEILKFRTMHTGLSEDIHREYIAKLAAGGEEGGLKKLTNDPRVTRSGRLLRKTSLDELPQLVNALLGSMSIVGPRPALRYELEHYEPHHYERFAVKPGMTGLWQVSGRNRLGFREMLDLDAEYARRSNFLLDTRILLKTPLAAVRGAA